jgi:hypothetical protein
MKEIQSRPMQRETRRMGISTACSGEHNDDDRADEEERYEPLRVA